MGAGVVVTELTFNDGSRIDCEGYDVILIVGPNNSGKTRSLMDIKNNLMNQSLFRNFECSAISEVKFSRQGTKEEVWDIVRDIGTRSPPNLGGIQ